MFIFQRYCNILKRTSRCKYYMGFWTHMTLSYRYVPFLYFIQSSMKRKESYPTLWQHLCWWGFQTWWQCPVLPLSVHQENHVITDVSTFSLPLVHVKSFYFPLKIRKHSWMVILKVKTQQKLFFRNLNKIWLTILKTTNLQIVLYGYQKMSQVIATSKVKIKLNWLLCILWQLFLKIWDKL